MFRKASGGREPQDIGSCLLSAVSQENGIGNCQVDAAEALFPSTSNAALNAMIHIEVR